MLVFGLYFLTALHKLECSFSSFALARNEKISIAAPVSLWLSRDLATCEIPVQNRGEEEGRHREKNEKEEDFSKFSFEGGERRKVDEEKNSFSLFGFAANFASG